MAKWLFCWQLPQMHIKGVYVLDVWFVYMQGVKCMAETIHLVILELISHLERSDWFLREQLLEVHLLVDQLRAKQGVVFADLKGASASIETDKQMATKWYCKMYELYNKSPEVRCCTYKSQVHGHRRCWRRWWIVRLQNGRASSVSIFTCGVRVGLTLSSA